MTVYPTPQEEIVVVAPSSYVPPVCANCKHWGKQEEEGDWRLCYNPRMDEMSSYPLVEFHRYFGCILFEQKE